MKKIFILSALIMVSSTVYAAGFQDSLISGSRLTVTQALKMNDDTYVTVQGNIIKRISDDKYLFKDATGTMTVEIDTDKWAGQTVNMTDKLELTGEIEKKFNSTVLDVDSVKIIK